MTLIQSARTKHVDKDPYWAADLMFELETRKEGLSINWLVEALRRCITSCAEPDQTQLCNWLNEIQSLRNGTNPELILDKGQEIWQCKRDEFHTAVGHLFGAIAHKVAGDDRAYRTSIIRVARVLGDVDNAICPTVDICLHAFQSVSTRNSP